MNMKRTGILAAAAAALILTIPAFAQHQHGHDHAQGQGHEGHEMKEGASCPHMAALNTSVDDAIALLEKAKGNPANVDKALAELREAKGHLAECGEMCEMHMKHGKGHANNAAAANKVTDPVCGMKIDPATAAAKSVHAGKTYYFCSKDEKAKFDKDPEAYLKKG
jgi:YHS domain-containing protein